MGSLDNLFSGPIDGIDRAMSLAVQRQALLTNNLANVNTPGFKRKDISFDLTLQEATGDSAQAMAGAQSRQFIDNNNQQLSDMTSIRQDGSNVDLEREVTGISETNLRYQTLTELATNYFTNMKMVIK